MHLLITLRLVQRFRASLENSGENVIIEFDGCSG